MSFDRLKTKNKIFLAVATLLLVLGVFVAITKYKKNSQDGDRDSGSKNGFINNPQPTPFLFQELTIPYLRNRRYESSLNSLEKPKDNSNYTSYLTSYDSDGLRINGLLTIPKNEKPEGGWPAVVFVHGYIPPDEYQTTQKYSSYVDYLASNGLVVFKIDLRGHDKSEGEASGAYYSSGYLADTLNAYSALQSAEFVNPKKIGLWGHSMAGNVIFRSFVVKKDIPAIVIWAGAIYTYEDMTKFGINDRSYQPPSSDSKRRKERERLRELYGGFSSESSFWQQVVPTNYLKGVKGALQINHATNDPVVSIDYSKNLMSILDETSIIHELNEYSSGGHNLNGPAFDQAMKETVEFYQEHLKIDSY